MFTPIRYASAMAIAAVITWHACQQIPPRTYTPPAVAADAARWQEAVKMTPLMVSVMEVKP